MSAFKQRLARIGASAGVLAVATAAILAVGGASAGSAFAAECPANELNIQGKGSSLQRVAMEEWTGREVPSVATTEKAHTPLSPSRGYFSKCGSKPPVSYSSTGSGSALAAFGFTSTSIDHTLEFTGSDDAPSAAQIANAETVSTTKPLVIPVAETSIAVVVHPPTGCTIKTGSTRGINYKQLTEVFGGKGITKWSDFGTNLVEGGASCEVAITRVVREDGSGTTFQFKNYLGTLQEEGRGVGTPCSLTGFNEATGKEEATTEWKKLRKVGTENKPNVTWPEPSNCSGTTALVRKSGGGGVAEYVKATAGTIGYAALPDAKGKGAEVARLQNSTAGTYALPESGTASNCGSRAYTVPAAGRAGSGTGEGVDWSQVFGASPTAGGTLYPLCTLTYDLSWKSYSAAGYGTNSAGYASDVKAFLKSYVLNTAEGEGQSILGAHYYQALPHPAEAEKDVLGAAELAAGKIG